MPSDFFTNVTQETTGGLVQDNNSAIHTPVSVE